MTQAVQTARRNLLKGGALLVGGAIGAVLAVRPGGGEKVAPDSSAFTPARSKSETVTYFGRGWHVFSQQRARGEPAARGDQSVIYGELLDAPDGSKVGEFYANALTLRSPFGPGPFVAANTESHTFSLAGGTVFGMGTSTIDVETVDTFAVVGGTGRYAGVRGTYAARQRPVGRGGGDGTAEIAFNLSW